MGLIYFEGGSMAVTSSGKISLPHSCPCPYYGCTKTAIDYASLDKLFGFRNVDASVRNHSWCRECRSRAARENR